MDYSDKKIGILGFGVENQALFAWLVKHGANNITICDKDENISKKILISNFKFPINFQISNIKFQTGKDYLKNLSDFDIVFRTPGISPLNHEIIEAKKNGVEISSEIILFMDLCPAKTIGVTGTKGKGTTSTLIYEILKHSSKNNRSEAAFSSDTRSQPTITSFGTAARSSDIPLLDGNVYLGGNIGNAPIEFLDKLTENDIVVLELSSFQLMDLKRSPNIAVVLDIESDHLDYHKNRNEYVLAKENIVKYQSSKDSAIVNMDYLTSFEFALLTPSENIFYFSRKKSVDFGTYIEWTPKGNGANFGKIMLRTREKDYEICKTYDITLRGEHNLENISAAITASYLAGANIKSISQIAQSFPGLNHRLEYVGETKGVKYYNDSFSTTPETAIAAIKSFSEPIVLIAGGSEKGAEYSRLARAIISSNVTTLIAIGVTGPKIAKAIQQFNKSTNQQLRIIENLKNMKEIIETAASESKSGDVVLLSPASASFGMFQNYKDRGNQFKNEFDNRKK